MIVLSSLWHKLANFSLRSRVAEPAGGRTVRLHLLSSTLRQLRRAVSPVEDRSEPLALLLVRYASEDVCSVVVGVRVVPFEERAYVFGPDGANVDVRWLMSQLDAVAGQNAGALLCHQHTHHGEPSFSRVDERTNLEIMAKQRLVREDLPYGSMVLSLDSARAIVADASGLQKAGVHHVIEHLGMATNGEGRS